MRNVWVFDGPDWVVFENESLILPSLKITFPGATITDLGKIDNGSWQKNQERGWSRWTFKVEWNGKTQEVVFRHYNLFTRADHL